MQNASGNVHCDNIDDCEDSDNNASADNPLDSSNISDEAANNEDKADKNGNKANHGRIFYICWHKCFNVNGIVWNKKSW